MLRWDGKDYLEVGVAVLTLMTHQAYCYVIPQKALCEHPVAFCKELKKQMPKLAGGFTLTALIEPIPVNEKFAKFLGFEFVEKRHDNNSIYKGEF